MPTEQDPYVELLKRQIKRAQQLDDNHLGCRRGALGHAWIAVRPDLDVKIRGAAAVAYQCQSCLAIKRGVVSKRYGEWLSNPTIEYPDGYLVRKEDGEMGPALSAQSVRAEFVARTLKDLGGLPPIHELDHHHTPDGARSTG